MLQFIKHPSISYMCFSCTQGSRGFAEIAERTDAVEKRHTEIDISNSFSQFFCLSDTVFNYTKDTKTGLNLHAMDCHQINHHKRAIRGTGINNGGKT